LAINLRGAALTCKHALRSFGRTGTPGAIVCLSSPLALSAPPGGNSAYCASKAGIDALVRSLAVDYASQSIRVNAIAPGPTETPLMFEAVSSEDVPEVRETVGSQVPLGRLAHPIEVAHAVLWLLSPQASFVTGASILCDGGVTAKASIDI
jgi:NAD(P)-dependent dehydrogenase (short-subunit alcohol dehydrogenase family)